MLSYFLPYFYLLLGMWLNRVAQGGTGWQEPLHLLISHMYSTALLCATKAWIHIVVDDLFLSDMSLSIWDFFKASFLLKKKK